MKNRNKEKSKGIVYLLFVGVAILMLLLGYTIDRMVSKFEDEENVKIVESESCEGKKLYYEGNGFDIYTYCLDSIKVSGGEGNVELKDLFLGDRTLKRLYEKLKKTEEFKDGGSIMYRDEEDGLSILKCNTLEGNKDIYIGKSDMAYEEDFCKNRYEMVNDEEFEVYFDVLLLTRANDGDIYLTLSIVNVGEVTTVKVKEADIKSVKKAGDYTFTFKTESAPFRYDIATIFEKSQIVSVRKGN
ncbi:MAG TPA: hypothetical protein DCY94_02050 [Firmicutes bacterium]|nr:hypothetical protein [Bacillota bacterium]